MIAPTSFFNDYGGHIRILEETLALQELGHEVVIVTYYQGNDVPGLTIRRTWPMPWRADYEVGSSRHKIAFDIYLIAKSIQVGYQFRPDIIHGHMHEGALIGSLVARLLRVPLVFDFQGSLTGEMVDHNFLNPKGFYFPWAYRLEGIIDRFPDVILTSSIRAQQVLSQEFGIDKSVITTLPDCVDTVRFNPANFSEEDRDQLRHDLGIPPHCPVVVYLGLLTDYQGVPHIIEAAAYLKEQGSPIHFLVMGFPNVDYYQRMADSLGVSERVTFTGRIGYVDAPRYLSLGNLAVSPKMSATEGSGKVLNYMAMGLPTIASDTPVHHEYLADLGIYLAPGDSAGLAQAIARFFKNPSETHCLGQKLRQRAIDSFNWRKAGESIVLTYEGLLK
jgi:glycosyltransferase involved in cell wall biosynthesis